MLPRRITLIRAALPVKCPACGAEVSWRHATAGVQFLCPACGHGVHLRNAYFRVLYLLSLLLVSLVAYALGIRGDALLGIVFMGVLPMQFLLVFITMRLFPPDAESTGDYRGILYGASVGEDRPTSERVGDNRAGGQVSTPTRADPGPHAAMFAEKPENWTLEGVVIRGSAIVLVLSMMWFAVQPLMYRILPEWSATKTGPTAFPVTVHIGREGMSVTDGSAEHWTCKTDLGVGQAYASTFELEPGQMREVPYVNFQRAADDAAVDVIRSAARTKISIECAERSGTTHFWDFR